MTFKVMPEVQLKVDSAYPGDQGGGKARLDPETMLLLKISPGDLVVIEGKRRTVAKVWRSLVEDWNQRKIRIDNFTRMNAGVSIGDTVKISTLSEEIEAKRVVLAPPEDLPKKIPIANNPHVINGLLDFPVVKMILSPSCWACRLFSRRSSRSRSSRSSPRRPRSSPRTPRSSSPR